jgi:hypothetical protein
MTKILRIDRGWIFSVGLAAWIASFGVGDSFATVAPSIATHGPSNLRTLAIVAMGVGVATWTSSVRDSRAAGWGFWLVLPVLLHAGLSLGRGEWRSTTTALLLVAICVAVIYCVPKDELFEIVQRALTLLVIISIVLGLLIPDLSNHERYLLPFLFPGRLFGIMGHANALGIVSGLLTICSIFSKSRYRLATCALSVIALLGSASQTSMIATAAAIFAVFFLGPALRGQTAKMLTRSWTAVTLLLISGFAWSMSAVSLPTFQIDLTFSRRTDIWGALVDPKDGLLGLGDSELARRIGDVTRVGSTHNMWLDSWLRDGVSGIVALLATIIALTFFCIKLRSVHACAILAFFVVEGITEGVLLRSAFWPLFVACFAAAFATAVNPVSIYPCDANSEGSLAIQSNGSEIIP